METVPTYATRDDGDFDLRGRFTGEIDFRSIERNFEKGRGQWAKRNAAHVGRPTVAQFDVECTWFALHDGGDAAGASVLVAPNHFEAGLTQLMHCDFGERSPKGDGDDHRTAKSDERRTLQDDAEDDECGTCRDDLNRLGGWVKLHAGPRLAAGL